MPSYIITCKENATDDDVAEVKQKAIEQGGTITHDFSLIKGFGVSYPDGVVVALDAHPSVQYVEEDQVVTTQ